MVLRRYALSIIALAILESGQWLKRELRFSFFLQSRTLTYGYVL